LFRLICVFCVFLFSTPASHSPLVLFWTFCITFGVVHPDSFRRSEALQHTATHCNTLQHTATHCYTLQHTATHCNTLQHTAIPNAVTHYSTSQRCSTKHCNSLQLTATHCHSGFAHSESFPLSEAMQHTATHCNTKHCNTLQNIAAQNTATQCDSLQHTATVDLYTRSHSGFQRRSNAALSPSSRRCCSVLQRVAVCCSVLQCVAECCSVEMLKCAQRRSNAALSPSSRSCCSVLHRVAVCCIALHCVAECCSVEMCT